MAIWIMEDGSEYHAPHPLLAVDNFRRKGNWITHSRNRINICIDKVNGTRYQTDFIAKTITKLGGNK